MKGFQDKVVWITGASSGIGEALVHAFAKEGAKIVLSARRAEELERVQQEAKLESENALILPLDIAKVEEAPAAVDKVYVRFGRVDIMVHNAGISNRSYLLDTSWKVFKRVMDVNFFGTIGLTQVLLPRMVAQKSGRFVVLSSAIGKYSTPGRGAYGSSKHALQGYFDTLRMEHFKDNIKVTIIIPPFVKTNVTRNSLTGDGTPQGKMDATTAGGSTPEQAAQHILKAIRKNKQEYAFGGKEKVALYIKRFFPAWMTWIILKNRKSWELGQTVE